MAKQTALATEGLDFGDGLCFRVLISMVGPMPCIYLDTCCSADQVIKYIPTPNKEIVNGVVVP
jgi:hypothetical protein